MRRPLPILALLLLAGGLLLPAGRDGAGAVFWPAQATALACAAAALAAAALRLRLADGRWIIPGLGGALLGAGAPLLLLGAGLTLGAAAPGLWLYLAGLVLLGWQGVGALVRVSASRRFLGLLAPALFGLGLLYLWQVLVAGFGVPQILLPAPSQIGHALAAKAPTLWGDFQQTFLKAVLAGFAMGCGAGFVAAVLIDRVPFLQRGLLPLGSLASAVPVVGVAPIMVMWFGFDWHSKAAVIVVMTFFPMLINTLAGFGEADAMSRDLMRSYGASYGQTFLKLRLPAALPFIFNALKINSTLALIGAIVAEFFGSPISGMGFRISVEIARMNVDVVWATIAVAALAGSLFYGLLALIERGLTFWHPSYRT